MNRFKNIRFSPTARMRPRPPCGARSNGERLTLVDVIDPISTPAEVTARLALGRNDLLAQRRRERLGSLIAPFGKVCEWISSRR